MGQESVRKSLRDVCGARKQPRKWRTNILSRACSQESKSYCLWSGPWADGVKASQTAVVDCVPRVHLLIWWKPQDSAQSKRHCEMGNHTVFCVVPWALSVGVVLYVCQLVVGSPQSDLCILTTCGGFSIMLSTCCKKTLLRWLICGYKDGYLKCNGKSKS